MELAARKNGNASHLTSLGVVRVVNSVNALK